MGFQPDLPEASLTVGFVPTPGLRVASEISGFVLRDPMTRRLHVPVAPPEVSLAEDDPEPADPAPLVIEAPAPPRSAPATYGADQLAAARAEAHREGEALGRTRAQAEFAAERQGLALAAQSLAAALAALAQPTPPQLQGLTLALNRAVLSLAAARAGQAIDSMPAPFARRVAALVERLGHGLQEVTVHLHPDDLAAVIPLLADPVPPDLARLAASRLLPDPALARGDADLRAPGVRLVDLLQDLSDGPVLGGEAA
nr:FliH/SctL family protein [Paracoccus saliphilus]